MINKNYSNGTNNGHIKVGWTTSKNAKTAAAMINKNARNSSQTRTVP